MIPLADERLDCMGLVCPRPLFETLKRLKRMSIGQTIEVVGDYPPSVPEITDMMRKQGQEIVSTANDGQVWHMIIRKTK
ncbi:MAG: sulfurtransferase TusA family protein [Methanomassiliicoccales archaeon]|nr:sulfurtransferase TusA family protein [Methanomassiliicoccales archaeon]